MKTRMKKLQKLMHFARNEAGGTLAELAILVPLLAVMLAAVSEFGRFSQNYTTMAKATRAAARYLSNHPLTNAEKDKAKNLATCGRLTSCGTDQLVKGMAVTKVCIETTGSPTVETVTVRIPRTAGDCGAPLPYVPIFNIGALLHTSFSFAPPIAPRTQMRYML
jgi:Flp pilus assembly protein TadG